MWGHPAPCRCGICLTLRRVCRHIADFSGAPGYVTFAADRLRSLAGELCDFSDNLVVRGAAPPLTHLPARESGVRETGPPPEVRSREAGDHIEEKSEESRQDQGQGREKALTSSEAGRTREEEEEGRSCSRTPPPHPRRDVPPEEARKSLAAKKKSSPPPSEYHSPRDHPRVAKREDESGDQGEAELEETPGLREVHPSSPVPREEAEVRSGEKKRRHRSRSRRRRQRHSVSRDRRSSSRPRATASRPSPPRPSSPPRPKTPPRPPPHWKGPVTIRPNNPLLRRPPAPPPDRDRYGTNKGVKKTERQSDFKEFLEAKRYLKDKERKGGR